MTETVIIEHHGPFQLTAIDMQLDDLCDDCGQYYCLDCEDTECPGVIERCISVPCLDCAVHKVRTAHELQVAGTIGTIKTKRR